MTTFIEQLQAARDKVGAAAQNLKSYTPQINFKSNIPLGNGWTMFQHNYGPGMGNTSFAQGSAGLSHSWNQHEGSAENSYTFQNGSWVNTANSYDYSVWGNTLFEDNWELNPDGSTSPDDPWYQEYGSASINFWEADTELAGSIFNYDWSNANNEFSADFFGGSLGADAEFGFDLEDGFVAPMDQHYIPHGCHMRDPWTSTTSFNTWVIHGRPVGQHFQSVGDIMRDPWRALSSHG